MLTDVSHISRSEPILATLQHPVIVVRIEEVVAVTAGRYELAAITRLSQAERHGRYRVLSGLTTSGGLVRCHAPNDEQQIGRLLSGGSVVPMWVTVCGHEVVLDAGRSRHRRAWSPLYASSAVRGSDGFGLR